MPRESLRRSQTRSAILHADEFPQSFHPLANLGRIRGIRNFLKILLRLL
jgi:hypothetical protein